MARAGFAGSLVVSAGWKGRNLNKGLRDSKKRVSDFGRSLRRTVGTLALGFGAFKGAQGLVDLIGWSKNASRAFFDLQLKWRQIKIAIADAVDGPLSRFIEGLTAALDLAAGIMKLVQNFKPPAWLESLAKMFAKYAVPVMAQSAVVTGQAAKMTVDMGTEVMRELLTGSNSGDQAVQP